MNRAQGLIRRGCNEEGMETNGMKRHETKSH